MIAVTRLNGTSFVVNANMIRYVEAKPDTFITLTDGERVVVTESTSEVVRLVVNYHRQTRLMVDAA